MNTISTALLALLLLPKLRASKTERSTPHLAIVSSGTHRSVKPELVRVEGNLLEHLSNEKGFVGQTQYAVSKLFVEYITKELAALTRKPNGELEVIVTSLCPGFCTSSLSRQYDSFIEGIASYCFYGLFGRSSEQGSRTLVSAVAQGEESHGKWWRDDEYQEWVCSWILASGRD